MSIFCDKCGYENKDTAKFCQGCGGEIILITNKRLNTGLLLDKRYEIKRKIKAGGMGAIYEALDHRFDKTPCAVKEMIGHSTDSEEEKYLIGRFTEEAKILHKLRHHNLPVVKDYFVENGRYYLVMDYIEGEDLDSIILKYEDKGVPENLVIKWSKQILDALEYLHNQSPPIIYRDLKPANVMLQKSEDKIILVDFGIARAVEPDNKKTLTVVGTPAFAPEELFHGKSEPRTDIYSLGATMHCLLTGNIPLSPFSFEPVRKVRPAVSEELESIVMKALAMKVENRYTNAKEMKEALEKITCPAVEQVSHDAPTVLPNMPVSVNPALQVSHDAPTVLPNMPVSVNPALQVSHDAPAVLPTVPVPVNPAVLPVESVSAELPTEASSSGHQIDSVKTPEEFPLITGKISFFQKKKIIIYSFIIFSFLTGILFFLLHFLPAPTDNMTLISSPSEQEGANGPSWSPSVSKEGLYMAFVSEASNLVEGDTNGKRDIFLWNNKNKEITLISLALDGSLANGVSSYPSISSDGTFMAFASKASNLVKDDKNDKEDIFLYNCQTGETTLVSVTQEGIQGNGDSSYPSISSDGSLVAFESEASNLIKNGRNGKENIFVWNSKTKSLTPVSVSWDGQEANNSSETPSISPDGRYVVFASEASNLVKDDKNGKEDIFLYDLEKHSIFRITNGYDGREANGSSYSPSVSSGGEYIVFRSEASNLVKDDKNDKEDVFLYEMKSGKTTCISVTPEGIPGNGASWSPSISSDGRLVIFISDSTNLVTDNKKGKEAIFKYDREKKQISFVSFASERQKTGHYQRLSVSSEGNYLGFESTGNNLQKNDVNDKENLFLQDLNTGKKTIVTTPKRGNSWAPSLSAEGKFTAFSSDDNLVKEDLNNCRDIYLYDREAKKLSLLSVSSDGTQGNDSSRAPSINADGLYVAFVSGANNLVQNDKNKMEDIFLRDRMTKTTELISVASDKKTQGNNSSGAPSISGDGRYVAFESDAANLIKKDLNDKKDIFIHDRKTGETSRISISSEGDEGNGDSRAPSISSDGKYAVFISCATNLVPEDKNDKTDVFLRDIIHGKTIAVSITGNRKTSDGNSSYPVISGDSNYITFVSDADNLVTGDKNGKKQVFLCERKTGKIFLISTGYDGKAGSDNSRAPSISYNGQYIAFISAANNLIKEDNNGKENVFLYNKRNGKIRCISLVSGNKEATGNCEFPSISSDGYWIAFASKTVNQEEGKEKEDIFLSKLGHYNNKLLNFIKDII